MNHLLLKINGGGLDRVVQSTFLATDTWIVFVARNLDCEVHIRGLGTNCLIKKAQQWLHFTAYTDCFILAHGLILLVERRLHSQLCLKKVRPSSTLLNVNKIDLFS